MATSRWLLLAHQLPARLSNARVKTWRRLQQIGAVPVRNSVYVLPNNEQCREDFEWLRSEIVSMGGEATVFSADSLDADGTEDIVAAFQRARGGDYLALKRDIEKMSRARVIRGAASNKSRDARRRSLRAFRERFSDIERIDFLDAAARREAADALAKLERAADVPAPAAGPSVSRALSPKDYHRRRWVTRPRPGVDRMASAWLIRRDIDPEARFAFVEQPAPSDVPFDMYVGEFSHAGSHCTFETLIQRFGVKDATAARIAQIVHDLDMKESRYRLPETVAIGRLVEGLRLSQDDDAALLEKGIDLFEALARSFNAGKRTKSRRTS